MRKAFLVALPLFFGYGIGRYGKPVPLVPTAQAAEKSKFKNIKVVEELDEFSPEKMIIYMKELKIKYIETTFAMSQLESDYYTSPIFQENNNCFGMKEAFERPTLCIGTNRKHAIYKNWRTGIIDFAIFQSRILAKTTGKESYRKYIAKYYSKDPLYLSKIDKKIENNRKSGIFRE